MQWVGGIDQWGTIDRCIRFCVGHSWDTSVQSLAEGGQSPDWPPSYTNTQCASCVSVPGLTTILHVQSLAEGVSVPGLTTILHQHAMCLMCFSPRTDHHLTRTESSWRCFSPRTDHHLTRTESSWRCFSPRTDRHLTPTRNVPHVFQSPDWPPSYTYRV